MPKEAVIPLLYTSDGRLEGNGEFLCTKRWS
jgi:hypothetical protein